MPASNVPQQYQGGQFAAHTQPQGHQSQYSNCTGRRKMLSIGIKYAGLESRSSFKDCPDGFFALPQLHWNFERASWLPQRYQELSCFSSSWTDC